MLTLATKIPAIIWLLISAFFFGCGEYRSKIWANDPSAGKLVLVVLCYAASSLSWLPALYLKNNLVVLGMMWLLLGTLATTAIGATVFGETLSPLRWSGVGAAALALLLLSVEH